MNLSTSSKRLWQSRLAGAVWMICVTTPPLAPQAPEDTIDYNRQIHAILSDRCLVCHSQEKRSGGLSLATYPDILNGGRSGAAVKPGSSQDSLLVQRITGVAATRMPLGGEPLSPSEIGVITAWIDQGARPAPGAAAALAKWEAPLTLHRPEAPAGPSKMSSKTPWKLWTGPLDRFTAAYFAQHGISQPKLISDAVFARRAYVDIWGLLPQPGELHEFLTDTKADKRARLVSRLLGDNRKYAEHWISYWNDLLRNEEGVTYYSETAGRKSITAWLLDALQSNLPYNQWIARLLNPTLPGDPDGFITGVNWRGTVSASQTPALQAAQNTAQIFLGINLKCNSCHDSFISKWKLQDAYSLAAYFSAEERLQLYRCDVAQDRYATAGFLYPELNRPLASPRAADRRAAAAAMFTDPRNGRVPRTLVNRIWQRLLGRGIVENVDEMDDPPFSPDLLDALSSDFVDSGYNLKALIAEIVNSRTYQLPAVPRKTEAPKVYVFRGPELRRLTAEQFADAVAAITGDWPATSRPRSAPAPNRGVPVEISGAPSDGAGLNRAPQPANTSAPLNEPTPIPPGNYVREWRIAGSSLDRALGRPIRDQVYSTRDAQATTIQELELVNGETLTHWLSRGASRMLGELPPEPVPLLARQMTATRSAPAPFEVDVSQSQKLILIVQDALSTAPDKAAPLWIDAELSGPAGTSPLSALTAASGQREDASPLAIAGSREPSPALRVKLSSVLVYDIAGRGFTRLRGATGFEAIPLIQGETVQARFFIFDRQPRMDSLVAPNPETPLPPSPVLKSISATVDRVYWYALGRAPAAAERRIAEAALRDPHSKTPSAEGLADLLWAVLMTPEFQLIR